VKEGGRGFCYVLGIVYAAKANQPVALGGPAQGVRPRNSQNGMPFIGVMPGCIKLENPTNEEHRKPSLHIMRQLHQFGARLLTETSLFLGYASAA
jgi:hypothetical protein